MPTPSTKRGSTTLVALGDAIRRLRDERNISQEKLALEIGINKSYISDIERARNSCSVLILVKIAEALGTSASQLLAEASL